MVILERWMFLMGEVPLYGVAVSYERVTPVKREFFSDNLLVRIRLILEMILVDRPCAMGVWITFSR